MAVRRALGALLAGVVVVAGLAGGSVSGPASADPPTDPVEEYRDDAGVPLTVHRDGSGRVDFIASRTAGVRPVGPQVSPARAARTQWARVAPVFAAGQADLRQQPASASVGGGSVVRLEQYVDGLPVLGGEVVLGLDEEGGLSSASASLTSAGEADPASYDIAKARANARRVVSKGLSGGGPLTVTDEGAWLYDSDLIGGPGIGERTVYRFTVADGLAVRQLVLVDATTGGVVLRFDRVARANRRVCDDANTVTDGCSSTSGRIARVEEAAESGVTEVDAAYDLLGVTSSFYAGLGVDLTSLIGRTDESGPGKALTASVRSCDAPEMNPTCPMQNAFWNGQGIFLGDGWADVDDVVGHELTHGVIERTLNLFYFHESGAINESLADVMGEIIDRRRVSAGDVASDWRLGEDSPGGALRDLADPTVSGQPDRMTSPRWDADESSATPYPDNGGVHTNSGVGNKTAYLISQGGTFNGRVVKGIDVGDPTMGRTAALYLYVIQHLTSGSQYADLGRVLVQGCQALAASGSSGFTSTHCDQVRLATEATELAKSPVVAGAVRPGEAPRCPTGSAELSRSTPEVAPASGAGSLWGDPADFGYPENSRDGNGSILGVNPDPELGTAYSSTLTTLGGITPEPGVQTYLWFSHWHLFEWAPASPPEYYDGGRVTLGVDVPDGAMTAEPPSSAWANGPKDALWLTGSTTKIGFGGDSNGWTSSRLDLSGYAGKTVRPRWTVAGDEYGSFLGWYLDEIEIVTCKQVVHNTVRPSISGTARVGNRLTGSLGTWGPATAEVHRQWLRNGKAIPGGTGSGYRLVAADRGTRISMAVTGAYGDTTLRVVSTPTAVVAPGVIGPRTPTISGRPKVGQLLSATRGTWTPGGITFRYTWLRDGRAISGATAGAYRLTRSDARHRIQVRVTGSKAGYTTVSRTSAKTALVAR